MLVSALDLSPVTSGNTPRDALLASVELARHAEAIGLTRYWVAEHHNAKGIACSAPEILIGQIANATKKLRVGSGGVMLPNHAPLRVAELFRALEAFFPGRIDLGLGRAAGTDGRTARLLRRVTDPDKAPSPDDFPEELARLTELLAENEPPRAGFATSVVAIPAVTTSPMLFVLGTSDFGAALAAKGGLAFAFAHQINPIDAVRVLKAYRRDFVPSAAWPKPHAIISVAALATDTEAEAEDAFACQKLGVLRFARGLRDLPFPSLEEARAYAYDAEDLALLESMGATAGVRPVGTASRVAESLAALARDAEVDEIMIMTGAHDLETRKRSYTLLAERLTR